MRNKVRILHNILAYLLRTYKRRNRKYDIVPAHKILYSPFTQVFALQFSQIHLLTLKQILRFRILRFALYTCPRSVAVVT